MENKYGRLCELITDGPRATNDVRGSSTSSDYSNTPITAASEALSLGGGKKRKSEAASEHLSSVQEWLTCPA
jgi:hypothetical protein